MNIGLVAIFKNEYPYILEWIAYHKNLGIDKFYIADNISDDGSTELLEALDELGEIKRIPFPRIDGQAPQAPAYNHIIKKYGHEVDVLGFIDADEFIISENGLKKDLDIFYKNHDYGAMGVNWKVYGSNDDFFSSNGLILERFTKHSEIDYDNNRHIKTFLKPSHVNKMHIHECTLTEGDYCNSSNEKMLFDESMARTLKVSHENIYVNHYVVKSRVEHFINKRKKGSAAGLASREKGIAYFRAHDENKITSLFDTSLIENVKKTINELKEQIINNTSFMLLGGGHVDVNTETNIISGWAFLDNKKAPKYLKVQIDDKEFKTTINRNRHDVFNKGFSSDPMCGFTLSPGIELTGKVINAYIYGSIQELKVKSF